jgi:glycosyltransferase involved in cell wall biosynthesis
MHVAFVLPRFYPYHGGYENSLLSLARYMVAHGHRATVFTTVANDLEAFWLPGFKTYPLEDITVDGVVVRRFPICYNKLRRRASRILGAIPYWRWKALYWRPSFRIPGLLEGLRDSGADLIHIGPLPYTNLMYYGLRGAELRRVPVVATPCTHLGEEGNDEVARHYVQPYQIDLLKRCAKVFCMTKTELRKLAEFGVTAEKLVIGHGIDLQNATGGNPEYFRQRYAVDGPVVLHLGMKAYDKGSQTLVEAMRLLWARGSNAWLVMAGPSLSAFDEFIAKNGKDCPRLLNLPPFADKEKPDFLASATVVAQPSRVESLGLVLVEAWANQKPVVAADIAVSRELVNESGGGLVVPFGNAEKLAEAVEGLLRDPALRDRMGAGGYQTAAKYQGETPWQRTTHEFAQVVASSSR